MRHKIPLEVPIWFHFLFCLLRVCARAMVSYILMSLTIASQQDIGWLRSITNLPILIKGVLTREDGRFSILWYLHLIIILPSLLLLMKMVRSSFITDIHISILHLPYFFLPLVTGRTFSAFETLNFQWKFQLIILFIFGISSIGGLLIILIVWFFFLTITSSICSVKHFYVNHLKFCIFSHSW